MLADPLSSSSSADFNIIDQAFAAAFDTNNTSATSPIVAQVASRIAGESASQLPPTSPSAETTSSGSSRIKFRSYNGPLLPEIETPSSHADLFYLAFGNGGSSSRQSLTGNAVLKRRERAEDDQKEREQKASDRADRDERRKQAYDDQFERPVNDDSTTGSQTESVTESSAASVTDSRNENTMDEVDKSSMAAEERAREKAQAEEKKRKRREAREKRKANRSPEQIIPAAVIMPITGVTILTKDGRALTNDPKDAGAIHGDSGLPPYLKAKKRAKSSLSSGSASSAQGSKIRNTGKVLRPQGSFTTARHPNMTIQADAIRAKALTSDDRFDKINLDQLQTAADAGDQIAEAHLRQRMRRQRTLEETGQLVLPADLPQNAPQSRRKSSVVSPGSRRRSSADSQLPEISRQTTAPVMQSIPEDSASNAR